MVPARTLLYVSPVVPADAGNGLAMRSRVMLGLLARRYDVSLLIVPLHGPVDAGPAASVRALCRDVAVIAPMTGGASPFLAALGMQWPAHDVPAGAGATAARFVERAFDVVHVYRLTALPYALPYLFGPGRTPARHVDLDEAESATRCRLARLCRTNGDETTARFTELEARGCARLERDILERFDRVYLSSPAERLADASPRSRATVSVVPNVIALPTSPAAARRSGPFRILFVGTLGFPANDDAVTHFCRDILPRLRLVAPRAFEFVVIGRGASPRLHEVVDSCGTVARLVGSVADLAPWYEQADAVVVPLRAGGGTRLKVLEAMSWRRPVVSTTIGVEGLDVAAGHHVLVGDTPESFAAQITRLMTDPALGTRLASQALDLVRSAHSLDEAATALFAGDAQ